MVLDTILRFVDRRLSRWGRRRRHLPMEVEMDFSGFSTGHFLTELPNEPVPEPVKIYDEDILSDYWEHLKKSNKVKPPPVNPVLKRPAEWEDLPMKFRTQMSSYLDILSRRSYSLCSKADKQAADEAEYRWHKLNILANPNVANVYFTGEELRFRQAFFGYYPYMKAARHMMSLFHNENTSIYKFQIGRRGEFFGSEIGINKMIKEVGKMRRDNNITTYWNVEKLDWGSNIYKTWQNDTFSKTISFMNPAHLKELYVTAFVICDQEFERLIHMEQWKKLHIANIEGRVSCALTNFYHLEKVAVQVTDFQLEELADFVKNYLDKNLPYPYQFKIRSRIFTKKVLKDKAFEYLLACEKFKVITTGIINNSQVMQIKIPGEKRKVLSVCVAENAIHGLFCPKDRYKWAHPALDPDPPADNSCYRFLDYGLNTFPDEHGTVKRLSPITDDHWDQQLPAS